MADQLKKDSFCQWIDRCCWWWSLTPPIPWISWLHQCGSMSASPGFSISGGEGSGLYITYNGHEHGKKIEAKDGIPNRKKLGRIGLAIAACKTTNNLCFDRGERKRPYKVKTEVKKWKHIQNKDIGGRPFFTIRNIRWPWMKTGFTTYILICREVMMEAKVFTTLQTMATGASRSPCLWIHPQQPSYLIDGNDGGAAIKRYGQSRDIYFQFACWPVLPCQCRPCQPI